MIRVWFAVLLAWLGAAAAARAHEVRPAYLEIAQTGPAAYQVLWKQPVMGEIALPLSPRLSNGWLDGPPGQTSVTPAHLVKIWRITSGERDPLRGAIVSVSGLDRSVTDVLVRVSASERRPVSAILNPARPRLALDLSSTVGPPAAAYLGLGVAHILTGVDHLAFVLALLLLVGVNARLLWAVTAFTLAHSITLAAAALGWVDVSSAAVEALVALSILFVALEIMRARRGQTGLSQGRPWLIAFTFGLLHGFAFAGALVEVGLPGEAVAVALFLFNVGVELGQLMFVAAAATALLAARWAAKRLHLPPSALALVRVAPVYVIGVFAAFWFIERTALALRLTT